MTLGTRRARLAAVAGGAVAALGLVTTGPAEGTGSLGLVNASLEAPGSGSWSGAGGATVARVATEARDGAHALAVTSGGPGSGVVTPARRPDGSPGALVRLAVRGTDTSVGQTVRAVVVDTVTGSRTVSAPVHLQPWWQTVGVRTASSSPSLQVRVEEVGEWQVGDAYQVDAVALAASGPRTASVSGRRLFVDGADFTIRGYSYSPMPVGGSGLPRQAALALGWHSNPAHCVADANLLGAAGVTALRIGVLDVFDDRAMQCLDAFAAAGIGLLWLVNGPAGWQGSDLPAYEQAFAVELDRAVQQVKAHPATLGYVIGNENSRTKPEVQAAWFGMLDRLAMATKATDADHLTTVSLAHQQFFGEGPWGGVSPTVATHVDLWGLNNYGNAAGYAPSEFTSIAAKDPSRPVWFSEFGTDRFRCGMHLAGFGLHIPGNYLSCRASTSAEAPVPQRDWDVAQWQDIEANLATTSNPGGAVVGATVFMWADSWWFAFPGISGAPTTTTVNHDVTGVGGTNPLNGQPNWFVQYAFPDQHVSPEWFGSSHALRYDQTGPRVTMLAYDGMAAEHTGTPGPVVSGVTVNQLGALCTSISFTTSVATTPRIDFGRVLHVQQGELLEADNTIADQSVQTTTSGTTHTLTLRGLTPSTAYRAYARGFTASGRSGTTLAIEWTTPSGGDGTCVS